MYNGMRVVKRREMIIDDDQMINEPRVRSGQFFDQIRIVRVYFS